MCKKRKILLFLDSLGNGGIEKVISSITNSRLKEKYNFYVCCNCFSPNKSNFNFGAAKLSCLSKHYISNPIKRRLSNFKAFKAFVKGESFDLIHLNIANAFDMYYGKLAKEVSKSPVVFHSHNSGVNSFDKEIINSVSINLFSKYGDYFISISGKAESFVFGNKHKETAKIIPNGIMNASSFLFNESKRKAVRDKLGIDENTTAFLSVGRISFQKNQIKALDIFSAYKKTINNNSIMYLYGDGDIKELIQKSESLKLTQNKDVFFKKATKKINEIYNAFDIFLFPSVFEGMGLSFIEAQLNGLACLGSTAIDPTFLISKKANLLDLKIPSNVWAKNINGLLADKRRSFDSIKAKNIKFLSYDNFIDSIDLVYKSFLDSK